MFGSVSLRRAATSLKLAGTARKGELVMRTKLLVLLAMMFTMAFVGTALAQDNPTEDAYGGVLGEEVSNQDDSAAPAEEESPPVVATQDSTDSLPFTGLELGLVALAGFGLVALGVAMRRTTRRSPG
jgi:hypothetical protein